MGWWARAPQGPASRIGRGRQGLDHMTQVEPTGRWVTVRLVATRPAGPVVKILTYFHPAAPGPSICFQKAWPRARKPPVSPWPITKGGPSAEQVKHLEH